MRSPFQRTDRAQPKWKRSIVLGVKMLGVLLWADFNYALIRAFVSLSPLDAQYRLFYISLWIGEGFMILVWLSSWPLLRRPVGQPIRAFYWVMAVLVLVSAVGLIVMIFVVESQIDHLLAGM